MDVLAAHGYQGNEFYLVPDRNIEAVLKSIEYSLCFGIYDKDNRLTGFPRVVTDCTVFEYLLDLIVLEAHRNHGLGKRSSLRCRLDRGAQNDR